MSTAQLIAEAVRALLGQRDERQYQLAEVLGMTVGAVSHRMSGRTPWTSDDLEALADHFGVAPAALLLPQQGSNVVPLSSRRLAHTREYVHSSQVAA